MSDYRNVWALIAAVGLLQVAGGVLGVITPLGLKALGVDPFFIGLIAALYGAGFMAGAWSAPRAIAAIGNIRVFSAAAAVNACAALIMAQEPIAGAWTGARLVQGLAFAWMFASAESWISAATPAQARGSVLGFYHVIAKACLMSGPFLIAGLDPLAGKPLVWAALFLAMALVPVCMTDREEPARAGRSAMGPRALLRMAPAAVWGVFLAGMINTGTMSLLPLFAQGREETAGTTLAAQAMAMAWLGGLVSQWPVGKLSDRFDRRVVIAVMAMFASACAGACALFGPVVPDGVWLALLALWGAGSLSFYGIAVAHGVDRCEPGQLSSMMAGLLFVWAFGSMLGPPFAGLAMRTPLGEQGLFVWTAALTLVLVLAMLWRRRTRPAAAGEARTGFKLANPNSVSSAEIDPRTDPR
jgi:MFS family permease